jgi:hypothetical protein
MISLKKNGQPHILIPLPDNDFDPTESSMPWKVCLDCGWKVTFSTETGAIPAADHRLLLGPILSQLGTGKKGLANYQKMTDDEAYHHPIPYADIHPGEYDGVALTGRYHQRK